MSGPLGPPISFAFFAASLFFPLPVPLHSWKRSNAVRRLTPPRLHCRFSQIAKWKCDPRGRSCSDECWHVRAVGPVYSARALCTLITVEWDEFGAEVSKGEAHAVLEAIVLPRFFLDVQFITVVCHVIDVLLQVQIKTQLFLTLDSEH